MFYSAFFKRLVWCLTRVATVRLRMHLSSFPGIPCGFHPRSPLWPRNLWPYVPSYSYWRSTCRFTGMLMISPARYLFNTTVFSTFWYIIQDMSERLPDVLHILYRLNFGWRCRSLPALCSRSLSSGSREWNGSTPLSKASILNTRMKVDLLPKYILLGADVCRASHGVLYLLDICMLTIHH